MCDVAFTFPGEAAFPPEIRMAVCWALHEAARIFTRFVDLKVNEQAMRIGTPDFDQAIPKTRSCLREDHLFAC